jgi:hypothetical protein
VLIGSADMMERNLDRRVEAVVPVTVPALAARLKGMLEVCLADDQLSWGLSGDGTWQKVTGKTGIDAHRWFQERAELLSQMETSEPPPAKTQSGPALESSLGGPVGQTAGDWGLRSEAPVGEGG